MKKIASLLLCLLFVLLALTGCSNDETAFVPKSYTPDSDQITGVCVDVRDRQIEVVLSTDSYIHIDYYENEEEYNTISVSEDNKLTMIAETNKEWTDYIGGKSAAGSRKITLHLPDKTLSALQLSTTNEDITLAALSIGREVSLSNNGGNISFETLNVGNSIVLATKNADISGSLVGTYEDYAITSTIKKGNSNLPADKEDGDKMLNASNNNGDINIEFVGE
ncbi:DUF4097 family beta strand repeat-containing protein [Clostridium sp. D33t1_170424_F3]|uniref:DUF4097 family beta strand repeat-containing protein n=1 Tax=Clostridium sp. D33t1_170424_F3 TaxID=2787099 RepID=UPI0018A9A878|nr:DUF4097 family beta strand repeat-containing protein [Clostridium sp. D33t1_170424_F3]